MRKRAGKGMTMTREHRKAIQRSRRRQRMVWGGTYSVRGMCAPVGKALAILREEAKHQTKEVNKISQGAATLEKLTIMGRILARLGFGRKRG